jgi:hypothetical protein
MTEFSQQVDGTEMGTAAKLKWDAPEVQWLDARDATAATVNQDPDGENCS